uniref:Uncharacterized protein LOC111110752 isoform X1 n=1 Tax=Crassostrea virginica TaxID=6565 RepID=A0A8B8BIH3_CRAVI|nr:uncharacterized protein LOC111110752 isoform X1 [Crassostrea virginica]
MADFREAFEDFQEEFKVQSRLSSIFGISTTLIFVFRIVLTVLSIVLLSWLEELSKVTPCELKTALDSIYLKNTTNLCKYNIIGTDIEETMRFLNGYIYLKLTFPVFFLICWLYKHAFCVRYIRERRCRFACLFWILFVICECLATIFLVNVGHLQSVISEAKKQQTDTDYVQLQTKMVSSLEKHYTSEHINNSDEISAGWNNFFIKYDCCAVRDVLSSENDFDRTPWCMSNGTCQQTISQIPKTCCKSVTQEDYQMAPKSCFEALDTGTYKSGCIGRIKEMSVVNIEEYTIRMVTTSISLLVLCEVMDRFIYGICLICWFIYKNTFHKKWRPDRFRPYALSGFTNDIGRL